MARAKGLCRVDSEHSAYEALLIGIVRQAARDARQTKEPAVMVEARRWLRGFAPEVAERAFGDD